VVGLGNPLYGDDGVGPLVVRRLAEDPRLPRGVETLEGGCDILRLTSEFVGRARVVLVDALAGGGGAGTIHVIEEADFGSLKARSTGAHFLSAVEGVLLMRSTMPELQGTSFTLIAVEVERVAPGEEVSPAVAARVPEVLDVLLEIIRPASSSNGSTRPS